MCREAVGNLHKFRVCIDNVFVFVESRNEAEPLCLKLQAVFGRHKVSVGSAEPIFLKEDILGVIPTSRNQHPR